MPSSTRSFSGRFSPGFLWLLGLIVVWAQVKAAPSGRHYHPHRILVQPRQPQESLRLFSIHHGRVRHTFAGLGGVQVVELSPDMDPEEAVRRCRASGEVRFAELNFRIQLNAAVPNDPRFQDGTLWGLHNTGVNGGLEHADIHAVEGWELQTQAAAVVVAVVDTGIRATHEDLAANLWTNPFDGSHGFNALDGSHLPWDDAGHGTSIAGIIGAAGNNGLGVVGVCWEVQIMACKFADASGGFIDDAIQCLDFARTNGAQVINASWGLYEPSASLSNALEAVRGAGIVVVAAAGNDGIDLDAFPYYPAAFGFDNLLSVGGSTRSDGLYALSNYGSNSVDVAAPAEAIYSTFRRADDDYFTDEGTSLAAGYVTGAAALLRARYTAAPAWWVVQRIKGAADPLPAWSGLSSTGGRLNLRRALQTGAGVFDLGIQMVPGALALQVKGEPDAFFVLESSADVQQWAPVLTDRLAFDGTWLTLTNSAGGAQRYYRARY